MSSLVRLASLFVLLACVGLLITSSGCSSNPATGKVTGKVTYNGEAVTSGTVTFSPTSGAEGKPAIGAVQSDGSYSLSTYAEGDGAVVGTHRVTYVAGSSDSEVEGEPSEEDGSEHDEEEVVEADPFAGLMPKQTQVTVEAGDNTIDIELVKAGGAAAGAAGAGTSSGGGGGEHAE